GVTTRLDSAPLHISTSTIPAQSVCSVKQSIEEVSLPMRVKLAIMTAASALLLSVPVLAHHSFAAEYDANKPIEIKGKVTKLECNAKGRAVPQGPQPRLADGTVDLTGIGTGGGPVGDLGQGLAKGETIPINDKGLALLKSRKSGDDPEANCLPTGIPRIAPY